MHALNAIGQTLVVWISCGYGGNQNLSAAWTMPDLSVTITPPLPLPRRSRLCPSSLAAITASIALLLIGSAPASAANERPDASFGVFPSDPVSGEPVRFVSYACDPDGRLAQVVWDFDGDGEWDDGFGRVVRHAFDAGSHRVSSRATDLKGAQSVKARVVNVRPGSPEYVLPRPFTPPFLSPPFPAVRLAGTLTKTGIRVSLLTVRAPVCSRVTVRCRGEGCPTRRVTRLKGRKVLRIRAFDGKRLREGVTLEVLVSKRDRIGKYTRFRIRRGRYVRFDTCLRFGARRGSPCPAG